MFRLPSEHDLLVELGDLPSQVAELFPLAKTDDVLAGFYVKEDGKANPVDVTMAIAKGAARFRSTPGAIISGRLPQPQAGSERDRSGRRPAPGSRRPLLQSLTSRRTRRNPSHRHTGPYPPGWFP